MPYVGLDLQDLTFIEQGNSDRTPDPAGGEAHFVNYPKMKMIASVLGLVRRAQQSKYPVRAAAESRVEMLWRVRGELSWGIERCRAYDGEETGGAGTNNIFAAAIEL